MFLVMTWRRRGSWHPGVEYTAPLSKVKLPGPKHQEYHCHEALVWTANNQAEISVVVLCWSKRVSHALSHLILMVLWVRGTV